MCIKQSLSPPSSSMVFKVRSMFPEQQEEKGKEGRVFEELPCSADTTSPDEHEQIDNISTKELSKLISSMDIIQATCTNKRKEGLKSALKQESLKQIIPISKSKKDYKVLPIPPSVFIRTRSQSCPARFVLFDGDNDQVDDNNKTTTTAASFLNTEDNSHNKEKDKKKKQRCVSFTNVQIRKYDITIGDNPCVSYGTPLSLDWYYTNYLQSSVDEYECSKLMTHNGRDNRKRNNNQRFKLNYYERKFRLIHNFGYTEEEVARGAKSILQTQRERLLSSCQPIEHIRDACESAQRKVSRGINGFRTTMSNSITLNLKRNKTSFQNDLSSMLTTASSSQNNVNFYDSDDTECDDNGLFLLGDEEVEQQQEQQGEEKVESSSNHHDHSSSSSITFDVKFSSQLSVIAEAA